MVELGEPGDTFEIGVQTHLAEITATYAVLAWNAGDETALSVLEERADRALEIREDFTNHVGAESFEAMRLEALERYFELKESLAVRG